MSDLKCTARVTVTLEVNLTQPWSEEVPLKEIFRQAQRSAKDAVEFLIKNSPEMVILGKMNVRAVMVPEARP